VNVVVVIADIVDSRSIENRQIFQQHLKEILSEVNGRSAEELLSPLTLTLGDEFQAVYGSYQTLFRDMVRILARISPHRLRIAIAYGALSTDINRNAALEMDGRVFNEARSLMDRLKANPRTAVRFTTAEPFDSGLLNSCLKLFSNELARWKTNSLLIFDHLLEGDSTERIAQDLGITVRAVNKNIATNNLRDFVELLESISTELTRTLHIQPSRKG